MPHSMTSIPAWRGGPRVSTQRLYYAAAVLITMSSVFHCAGVLKASHLGADLRIMPVALFYPVFAYGLLQQWRWTAIAASLIIPIFTVIAALDFRSSEPLAMAAYAGHLFTDALAVLALCIALSRRRAMENTT